MDANRLGILCALFAIFIGSFRGNLAPASAGVESAAELASAEQVVTDFVEVETTPTLPDVHESSDRTKATAAYIAQFDPRAYELAGLDFFSDRYCPLARLGKPYELVDRTYDYDLVRLQEVSDRMLLVDRKAALKAIFDKVAAEAKTNTSKHLAVLKFLQQAAYHNLWMQPIYADLQGVVDPLVLLELGDMRCGAVARLGVDLFEAAGYSGRLVQCAAHVTAEVFYDGSWHLFEADLSGGGQAIIVDGRIPSMSELANDPYLIDSIPAHFERYVSILPRFEQYVRPQHRIKETLYCNSYYFFCAGEHWATKPCYCYKTATPEQAAGSRSYGWDYYRIDHDAWPLAEIDPKQEPAPPAFTLVEVGDGRAIVQWDAANDSDGDLIGYRVYISSISRGWQHQEFRGSEQAKHYWHGGWNPAMYDAMFHEPPSDVDLITTSETSVTVDLPEGQPRYVTVMPFDRHGEAVGRRLNNMSEELTLTR